MHGQQDFIQVCHVTPMPRKEQRRAGPTLFDFAVPQASPQAPGQAAEKPVAMPTQPPAGQRIAEAGSLEADLLAYIASRGLVTKEELYVWGRQRGLSAAAVIRAVEALASSRRIRRRLNEEGKLAYEAV